MFLRLFAITCLCACATFSLAPDKVFTHIIKTRSIDLNNAHGLAMENRLGRNVVPTGYYLELEPYIEDGVYEGRVVINVTWNTETDEINLHCAPDVAIVNSKVELFGESGKSQEIAITQIDTDAKKSTLKFQLEKSVPASSIGALDLSFKGKMETSTSEGLFKSSYKTDQDEERIVVATQFRPNNARRMFPCFDEPEFKVPFDVSIVRPLGMIALSNMAISRVENITDEPNAELVHFKRSPPMSTFTMGFVLADLVQLGNSIQYSDKTSNNFEMRVWGRPEYLEALQEVPDKFIRILNEIAEFNWPPLPLDKLDIVALPNYQGVKPTDNWGLIVFRESDLSSSGHIQLTHEVLHQWLGALVTPAWWSDAHVNKALVGYLAVETAYKINRGCEMEVKWPMTFLYSLYYEYSKRYPHSRITGMKQETVSTKIELLFRMFNYTLGDETLKKGLKMFVTQRAFQTFDGDFLWQSLNTAASEAGNSQKIDVKAIAQSWIEKDRLPVVTVKRNYDSKTAVVSQKLYLRERPHDVPDAGRMSWWIPLVVVRGDNLDFNSTAPLAWMKDQTLELNNMPSKEHFIIVNPEEIGPFPVNYDEDNWNLIAEFLKTERRTKIPELTRAKVLHDAWNLAFAGELSFATALNMTLFLKHEENLPVWDPVFTMIDHIDRHIWDIRDKFNAYVISLLRPPYIKLTKDIDENEKSWRRNMRNLFKTFLCSAGYKPCIKDAQEQYSKWMKAQNPDEGNPVSDRYLCPVFRWGTQEEWNFGLQRVINFPPSRKQSERTYLLKTLSGCCEDKYKLTRLLNITLLEENGNFTERDIFLINNMFSDEPVGHTTLLHFIDDNWNIIKQKYYHRTNLWSHLISTATSYFTTKAGLDLVTQLYVKHQGEFGPAEHIIEKAIRNIKEESKWSSQNLPVMEKWLDDYLERNGVKVEKKY
ncbi:unnamed protein product [Parnassius mnemosyne]|uniref:Aminopeptidase n=1 Tax=Parnassius mnemosyne TaxID=213953 RepID=A0AAV1LUH4_9NEOP